MNDFEFDLFVIGGGSGGVRAARVAAGLGARVAIAESSRDKRTLIKLVVANDSQRILGIRMVGPDAPEIVQGLAVALRMGATEADFDATLGIHPTSAEEFMTLRDKQTRRRPD